MSQEAIVEILNYTVIVFGLIGKLPQIQVLYKQKNPAGLSMKSTLMELLAFLIIMSYCAKQGYPLKGYLEIVSGVVQTLIFLLMLLYYQGSLSLFTISPIMAVLGTFYSLYLGIPHSSILDYLIAGVSLILASSKVFQIKELWTTENSNNVSISRWLIVSYLSFARILTQLMGVMDKALFFNAALAFVLNIIVVALSLKFRQPQKTRTD